MWPCLNLTFPSVSSHITASYETGIRYLATQTDVSRWLHTRVSPVSFFTFWDKLNVTVFTKRIHNSAFYNLLPHIVVAYKWTAFWMNDDKFQVLVGTRFFSREVTVSLAVDHRVWRCGVGVIVQGLSTCKHTYHSAYYTQAHVVTTWLDLFCLRWAGNI